MDSFISVSNLYKFFGKTHAVEGINLEIPAGEIYGLVGSDGAGKTTILRLLVGALKPDQGTIRIGNYDVISQTEGARSLIGYLSQRFSLYDDLSVMENIRFFAEIRGLKPQEWNPRCMEILEFVGLSDFKDRRAGQLSGGMKQKLGLASALVSRPVVLLLDEPTTGVDPVTRQDFWHLIIRITSKETTTVLLTTPYMDEAARCSRVGFVKEGKMIMEGTPHSLRGFLTGRIIEIITRDPMQIRGKLLQINGVEDTRVFGDKLHLRVDKNRATEIVNLLNRQSPTSIEQPIKARLVTPSLEDVFIAASETGFLEKR